MLAQAIIRWNLDTLTPPLLSRRQCVTKVGQQGASKRCGSGRITPAKSASVNCVVSRLMCNTTAWPWAPPGPVTLDASRASSGGLACPLSISSRVVVA